jgi:hypothetical protein
VLTPGRYTDGDGFRRLLIGVAGRLVSIEGPEGFGFVTKAAVRHVVD